jgi:hypothetical protein
MPTWPASVALQAKRRDAVRKSQAHAKEYPDNPAFVNGGCYKNAWRVEIREGETQGEHTVASHNRLKTKNRIPGLRCASPGMTNQSEHN